MPGKRHKTRAFALRVLFEADTARRDARVILERALKDSHATKELAGFARELVEGVLDNQRVIDDAIGKHATAWPLEQLPAIDRNILRLAMYEILIDNKVPVGVAISEAVVLAKDYGSEGSPRFINGVLGAVSLESGVQINP